MAGYHGTRKNGVNVSQYIANLNKEPSAFEVARSEEQSYAVDDESLAQFTNAEFLDFDSGDFLNEGNGVGGSALEFQEGGKAEKQKADVPTTTDGMDFVNGHFPLQAVNPFDINTSLPSAQQSIYGTGPNYPSQHPLPLPGHYHHHHHHHPTSPSTTPPYHGAYPPHHHGHHPAGTKPPSVSTTAAAAAAAAAVAGGVSSPTDPTSPSSIAGDPARALAEEDKRRRNTAASARFRVKKKQREQALELKTQELEKAKQTLEQRVGQLETENEWLRGLVVEKNGGGGGGGAKSGAAGASKGGKIEGVESKLEGVKKGVGTTEV